MAHPGGRPTLYKVEYNKLAYNYCLLGATDKDLATYFDTTEETINNWKVDYPEFFQSLSRGKEQADAEIAQSLFHRAKGYSHKELVTATFQGQITDTMEVEKFYPPDTEAAKFWLKNRRRGQWSDKIDLDITARQEMPDKQQLKNDIKAIIQSMDPDELQAIQGLLSDGNS